MLFPPFFLPYTIQILMSSNLGPLLTKRTLSQMILRVVVNHEINKEEKPILIQNSSGSSVVFNRLKLSNAPGGLPIENTNFI